MGMQMRGVRALLGAGITLFVLGWMVAGQVPPLRAQEHHHDAGAAAPAATAPAQQPSKTPEILRGKKFSEFNHRVAGVFVLLAGVFYLLQAPLTRRWPVVRYAWPFCLFIPGLYLMILSDPRMLFGPDSFLHLLRTSLEFRQHKAFSAILLALGAFEFARIRGKIRGLWSAFVFPALGIAGAVMLLYHPHGAGHTAEHMAIMERIQAQHLDFAIVGALIAVSKGLSEAGPVARRFFTYAWPSLMMLLGLLLVLYKE